MRKKFISLVVATGMITGIGVVGATGAQAESLPIGSTILISPIPATPNYILATDGGGSSSASNSPSIGSTGRQFCYAVRVVTGFTTVWLIFGNVAKPIQVAVYGTEWFCTMIYG